MLKDCAVLILSCDAYSDTWEPFFHFYEKYWQGDKPPTYLLSNHLEAPRSWVQTVKAGKERNWTKACRMALEQVKEKYVILLLEDYFLTSPTDLPGLQHTLDLMENKNLGYFRLFPVPSPKEKSGVVDGTEYPWGMIKVGEPFRTSLQAAIWERKMFIDLLLDPESAWEFERISPYRAEAYPDRFGGYFGTPEGPLPLKYLCTAVVRGTWIKEAVELCQSENLVLDLKRRRIEPWHKKLVRTNKLYHGIRWAAVRVVRFFVPKRAR